MLGAKLYTDKYPEQNTILLLVESQKGTIEALYKVNGISTLLVFSQSYNDLLPFGSLEDGNILTMHMLTRQSKSTTRLA